MAKQALENFMGGGQARAVINENFDETYNHIENTANPHSVTASQTGAIPTTQKGVANGVAQLDATGKIPAGQLPPISSVPDGGTTDQSLVKASNANQDFKWADRYAKPVTGIPASDLDASIKSSLLLADGSLQKTQSPFDVDKTFIVNAAGQAVLSALPPSSIVTDNSSVKGNGLSSNPISAKISTSLNNQLVVDSNGLYVPAPNTGVMSVDIISGDTAITVNNSDTANPRIGATQALKDLFSRVANLENWGEFIGAFDTKAEVPTSLTAFPGAGVNDFVIVRADETKDGKTTMYIISSITSGTITWEYTVTFSTDLTGKIDRVLTAIENNVAVFDNAGGIKDGGFEAQDIQLRGVGGTYTQVAGTPANDFEFNDAQAFLDSKINNRWFDSVLTINFMAAPMASGVFTIRDIRMAGSFPLFVVFNNSTLTGVQINIRNIIGNITLQGNLTTNQNINVMRCHDITMDINLSMTTGTLLFDTCGNVLFGMVFSAKTYNLNAMTITGNSICFIDSAAITVNMLNILGVLIIHDALATLTATTISSQGVVVDNRPNHPLETYLRVADFTDILVHNGEFIPDSIGNVGQVGICRSGIFRKQTKADPRGLLLTGSQTNGGTFMPSTSNADGFFQDMGVNTLVPAGQGNSNSRAWGSPWYYNQQKQVVLVWNDSYGSNGTFSPVGQWGYWWMNVVHAPYGQTEIETAMRRDNGSADYYIYFVQPSPINAPPPVDGSIMPPSGGGAGGNPQNWSTNSGQVGSFTIAQPNRMVFTLQPEVIGDKWIPFNMDEKLYPQPREIVTDVVTQTANLMNVSNNNDFMTGRKVSTVNATVSDLPNNAIQGVAAGLLNSETDWKEVTPGTWGYKYRISGNGFWSGARRQAHTSINVGGSTNQTQWNVNTQPNHTVVYTSTSATFAVRINYTEQIIISGSQLTFPNTSYATLMIVQGNAIGTSKRLTFEFEFKNQPSDGSPPLPVMTDIKWSSAPPTEIMGGNTYMYEIWRFGAEWYGRWELMVNEGGAVRTGSDIPNAAPINYLYQTNNEADASALAKQYPNRAFAYPVNVIVPGSFTKTTYHYTGTSRSVTLPAGEYLFECWGAQCVPMYANYGGYVRGKLILTASEQFFIFVGGMGERLAKINQRGGWNGGGGNFATTDTGGAWDNSVGGGASDISIVDSTVTLDAYNRWVRTNASYIGRIMVAGGGGGGRSTVAAAQGGSGTIANPQIAGTQTQAGVGGGSVGVPFQAGGFGFGMATGFTGDDDAGGGGGYYGGGIQRDSHGGGGSSFISGHSGHNAVDALGAHTGQPNHYSGLVFTDTVATPGVRVGHGVIVITPIIFDTWAIKMSTIQM